MSEKEPRGERFPGETIKRKAAARLLREFEDPLHWDTELLDIKWAMGVLSRDTGIPLRDSTLEMIEIKHGVESK